MKKEQKQIFMAIIGSLILSFIFGMLIGGYLDSFIEAKIMEDYDLYNCIYNNAEINEFNKNPIMIKKIQDECICFRENNYTNLLEVNCLDKQIINEID